MDFKTLAGQTFRRAHPFRDAGANSKPDVASVMSEITATYRNWLIEVSATAATATTAEGERFECYRQADTEKALRLVRNKIEWLEGPEEWNENYEREALD